MTCPLPRAEVSQQGIDLARMNRLDEVKVEPRLACLLLIRSLPIAGDRDEAEFLAVRGGPNAPRDFIAIEAGESDVHEGGVGAQPEHEVDTARPILGLVHLVPVDLKQHAERLARIGIVFDDDDPPGGHGDRGGICREGKRRQGEGGKAEGEDAAGSRTGARRLRGPVVELDQALDQGQANAEAAVDPIGSALTLTERVEDAREKMPVDDTATVLT